MKLHLLAGVALIAASATWITPAEAAAAAPQQAISIPAGDLATVLDSYVHQTGRQLIYRSDEVRAVRSPGTGGALPADSALAALLRGTGFMARTDPSGAIAIVRSPGDGQHTPSGEASAAASPAGGEAAPAEAQDILVTANRREQKLKDVPMSVRAVSHTEIEHEGIKTMLDLARAVPGLVVEESGPGQNRVFMRGIANGNSSTSLIGAYLDEMPITGSAFAQLDVQLVDLERVEVLRGPQGTLYGQGSAGGTIRFITRDPELDHYSGQVDSELYATAHGDPSARLTGIANIPIVPGKLGLRAAGTFANIGGWVDQPDAGRKDINNQRLREGRVKALWTPAPEVKISAFAIVHRNRGDGMAAGADGDYDVFFENGDRLARERLLDNFDLYNVTASYDFGPATILSSTGYTRSRKKAYGYAVRLPDLSPGYETFNEDNQDNRIFTQEVRVSASSRGPFNWVGGFYYTDELFDRLLVLNQYLYNVPLGALPLPTRDTSKAWSVFGDASYAVTPRFTAGAGVRYFHDRRGQQSGGLDLHNGFTSVDPRFYATFAVTPSVTFYANAAKGFRSGGFSGDTTGRTFGPETVWSYEAGAKGALGRMLQFDVSAFYSDYKDIQTFAFTTDITGGLVNSGSARIKGVDWLLAFTPTSALTFEASGNVTDSKFVKVLPTSLSNQVGDRVDFIPDYAFSLSAEYRFNEHGDFPGYARVDYNQVGKATYTDHSAAQPGFPSDTLNLLNARIGVRHKGFTAELFGQNLLGEHGIQDPLAAFGLGSRPRPRVIGIKLGSAF
jgi:outer membrane receptor protein involved in Fe transport